MNGMLDIELIGIIVGAVMTLMILSYIFTDSFLYRWALALLVGSSVGYALGIVIRFVLLPWFTLALGQEDLAQRLFFAIPLFLGILLLLKGFTPSGALGRIAVLGNISMGFLIGVGAAIAISGALTGTLIPQVWATGQSVTFPTLLTGAVMVVGTITSLLVFSPRQRADAGEVRPVMLWLHRIGRFFIVTALAVAFVGTITSALTTLVMRVWQIASGLMGG